MLLRPALRTPPGSDQPLLFPRVVFRFGNSVFLAGSDGWDGMDGMGWRRRISKMMKFDDLCGNND